MPDITLTTLQGLKERGEKIVMLTCYDATFAHAASSAGVEMLLVGDTLGMVLHGHDSTLPVEVEDVAYHTACVKRGNAGAFIVGDMPFMSYATLEQALQSAGCLMKAGAHMVKLEGDIWLADTVRRLTENGVPVCVHLGLTPQSVNVLGGFKVQGRDPVRARQLVEAALRLEEAGAAMLLVECLPSPLAEQTQPGREHPGDRHWRRGGNRRPDVGPPRHAGPVTDRPHARNSCAISWPGKTALQSALEAYVAAVKSGDFPAQEHGYLGVKRSRQQSSTGPFLAAPSPSFRQFPVWPNEMAGVTVGIVFEVVLMFRFCFPERACGHDFSDDLVGPQTRCISVGNRILGHLLLFIVEIEECRAVAHAHIVALTILRRRVVDLEEKLEDLAIADLVRIEHDLDRFRVRAMVAVSRIGYIAARVSHPRGHYAGVASQQILHAPEAATCQDGSFSSRRHSTVPPISEFGIRYQCTSCAFAFWPKALTRSVALATFSAMAMGNRFQFGGHSIFHCAAQATSLVKCIHVHRFSGVGRVTVAVWCGGWRVG